ncbi:hypothetical protein D3C81_1179580 [compost metagenome]
MVERVQDKLGFAPLCANNEIEWTVALFRPLLDAVPKKRKQNDKSDGRSNCTDGKKREKEPMEDIPQR